MPAGFRSIAPDLAFASFLVRWWISTYLPNCITFIAYSDFDNLNIFYNNRLILNRKFIDVIKSLFFAWILLLCLTYIGWPVHRSRPPWPPARSLRLGECDGRYQGDQPSAIKNICRGYNFLKSGLGQGFPVKVPLRVSNNRIRHQSGRIPFELIQPRLLKGDNLKF